MKEFCIRQPAGGACGMLEKVARIGDIPTTNLQPATGIDRDGDSSTRDGSDEGSQGQNQGKDPCSLNSNGKEY